MPEVICSNCGNVCAGGSFCEFCGATLPRHPVQYAPVNQQSANHELSRLARNSRQASYTLLAVTYMLAIVALIVGIKAYNTPGIDFVRAGVVLLIYCFLGTMFLGFFIWARFSPLPPTILGLIFYCTFCTISVMYTLRHWQSGEEGSGVGGIGIGWIDIAIIIGLANGIRAAIQQKRLLASR